MQRTSPHAVPSITAKIPRRYSFRAFYATVLCISLLVVASLVAERTARYHQGVQYGSAQRRALEELDITRLVKREKECRLVRHAEDKCAFIKANCPDEEAGLLSYLSLYYCSLQRAQPIAFIILSLWLALLFTTIGIAASDFFCINLSTIASILGMSESMAGVTFLAFGNGSPDVFSTFAAMSSHSGSLAIGELIGAAGFITAVVAGSMALVREFKVGKRTFVRDVGFFIVAAGFSMAFLADGALQFWECCVMIGFYLFYVVVVVCWHWYLGRRRRRRERESTARAHYLGATSEEVAVPQDDGDDDEDAPAGHRRHRDEEDFDALERASSPLLTSQFGDESDEEDVEGRQLATEMASSMRIKRGIRRNTITPIRPSLVGALEFRSILSSLQKARGSQARLIHLRRYSDDSRAIIQHDGPASEPEHYSDNADDEHSATDNSNGVSGPSTRIRAVSLNDAAATRHTDPAAFNLADVPNIGIVAATPTFPRDFDRHGHSPLSSPCLTGSFRPASSSFSVSPPPSFDGAYSSREAREARRESRKKKKRNTLAPPEQDYPGTRQHRVGFIDGDTMPEHPRNDLPEDRNKSQEPLRLQIPGNSRDSSRSRSLSPTIAFPAYTDSSLPILSPSPQAPSLVLPDASLTPESLYDNHQLDFHEKVIKWWPYRYLPSPYTLTSTLFPTLCTWRDKTLWDKFVSVISAPCIFLLAITLPVVEADSEDDEGQPTHHLERDDTVDLDSGTRSGFRPSLGIRPSLVPDSPPLEAEPEWARYRRATDAQDFPQVPSGFQDFNIGNTPATAGNKKQNSHISPMQTKHSSIAPLVPLAGGPTALSDRDWNRWLVVVQIFTAPLFVVLIVWANTAEGTGRFLMQMILYSLLGSLVVFAILILTTSAMKPPKYRFLLCFLGFVVSVAWISTIANEVVGVLKAFGVILGISDAILGLTIFAVGNSLGDLVADITVARLGYPVMALSACFGGPLLNILLGIGVSGLYMTVTDANHKHAKHPGKAIRYEPYEIDVSGTLMVSGITLLMTLVGLLIVVPMNKWIMSRQIGWALISVWAVSTVINLGVEMGGGWGSGSTTFLT